MLETRIPLYGLMILLSLTANMISAAVLSKKYGFAGRETACLLLYENTGIIGGAKLLSFLQGYGELNGKFDFFRLGLSSCGAAIGALIFLILFGLQFHKSIKEIGYVFMPSLPLMYGIGKIGCFFAGCCYGVEYGGFGSVVYRHSQAAPEHVRLFPVQLAEAVLFIGIFVYMIIRHKRNRFDHKTLGAGFILCGLAKFLLDFLRAARPGGILSLNQLISAASILLGAGIVLLGRKKAARAGELHTGPPGRS